MNSLDDVLQGDGQDGRERECERAWFSIMDGGPVECVEYHQMICIVLWKRTQYVLFWGTSLRGPTWIGMMMHSARLYSNDFFLVFPVGYLWICRVSIVDSG